MNWIISIISLIILLLLFLPIIELGIRWWLRRRNCYYVWYPYLRFEFYPDMEVYPELEKKVRFEFNSFGERGNEIPTSDAGLYRVLVAGGSSAECALLDFPTSWSSGALENILKKPENLRMLGASKVHVGSIARSGISSAHLNFIFQKVLPQYKQLSAIIVMVGGNDIWNWLQSGAPAIYTPSQFPINEACIVYPNRPFGWSPKVTAISELLREIWRRFFHPVKVHRNAGKWVGKAREMRAHAKEIRNSVADPKDMLANFERNLAELLKSAKSHATRVIVVLQPWFEKDHYTSEEASHFWSGGMGDPSKKEEVTVFYSLEMCNYLMRLIGFRAAKVANDLGVEHLNLMPLLEPSLKTFYDFIHFTPAGSAVVAEAVAKTLLQSYSKKP